jgi:hypothetical protein
VRLFLIRFSYLTLPVYVAAVLIWRYALGQSWRYSLGGVPLGLLLGGLIYCGATTAYLAHRRR